MPELGFRARIYSKRLVEDARWKIEDGEGEAHAGDGLQEEASAGGAVQRRLVGEAGDAAWDEVLRANVEAQDALLQSKDALLQAKDADICCLQADIARGGSPDRPTFALAKSVDKDNNVGLVL